jgi:hypothetical protein
MGVKRRRGVVYVILTIVMLPVFGAFIAMAIEMMSFALSSRVAFNLAMVGATAITSEIEVGGGYEVDINRLCRAARTAICSQADRVCEHNDGVICVRRGDEIFVRVRVPRYLFFGPPFRFLPVGKRDRRGRRGVNEILLRGYHRRTAEIQHNLIVEHRQHLVQGFG